MRDADRRPELAMERVVAERDRLRLENADLAAENAAAVELGREADANLRGLRSWVRSLAEDDGMGAW